MPRLGPVSSPFTAFNNVGQKPANKFTNLFDHILKN